MRLTRREWLFATASGAAGGVLLPAGCSRRAAGPDPSAEPMARFPGKVPMRVVNDRPPCLETPWRYFREDFTPNEAFYVRWHLQAIPTAIELASWRLRIDGAVDRPLDLSMDDLKRLGTGDVIAVNQCSGNSRSLLAPRVTARTAPTATSLTSNSRSGPPAATTLAVGGARSSRDATARRTRPTLHASNSSDRANRNATVAASAHSPMTTAPRTATTIKRFMSGRSRFNAIHAFGSTSHNPASIATA